MGIEDEKAYYAIGKNVRFRGIHCEIEDLPRDMDALVWWPKA